MTVRRLVPMLLFAAPLRVAMAASDTLPVDHEDLPVRNVTDLTVLGQRVCATTGDETTVCWQFEPPAAPDQAWPRMTRTTLGGGTHVALHAVTVCVLAGDRVSCVADGDGGPWSEPWPAPDLVEPRDLTGDPVGFCALGRDGAVDCWGFQADATHAVGGSIRDQVPGGTRIAGGPAYACVLAGGEVACTTDIHAHNFEQPRHSDAFERVPQLRDAVQLAVTPTRGCALRKSGQVLCWTPENRADLGKNAAFGPLTVAPFGEPVRQLSAAGDRLCGVTASGKAICIANGHRSELDVQDPMRVVAGTERTCAVRSGGQVRCWGARPPAPRKSPTETGDSEKDAEFPNALGQFNLTLAMGGGARTAPDRLREKIFEMGLRGAFLFGRPARDRRGWGVGPVLDLRTADFSTFGVAGGLGGILSIVGPLQLDLRGGYGFARRRNEDLGHFVFGTGSLGVRFPLVDPDRPAGGPRVIYAWPLSLYVSVRRNVERPFVHEWTVGFETDPFVWAGVPIYLIYTAITGKDH